MDDPRIVVTRPLPGDAVSMLAGEGLTNVVTNDVDQAMKQDALLDAVEGATGVISTPVDRIDSAFFDAAGDSLRVVSNYAVGYDNVDVEEARRRRIRVGHTPNAVTEPTADIAWLLLLAASRRATEGSDLVRSGEWKGVGPNELLGRSIVNKTLFIVGAGRIGYATARRSIGWNMRVLYHARTHHPEFERAPIHAHRVSLETGLREADFISVHTPLTKETHHLIGERELALVKPTAVVVNTARGAVIDEAALSQALRSGQLYAAGLDVFEREPVLHPGLSDLANVFVLPHLGSATDEDRAWMMRIAVTNVAQGVRGEALAHAVV